MLGWFGKKKRPSPSPHQVEIIPSQLWQGEIGQALCDAGLRPDDASNLLSFANAAEARMAQAQLAMEVRIKRENAETQLSHAGCSLAPFYIFTQPVWEGPHGRLLSETLALTPYDVWNVRLLAADGKSAAALNLPLASTTSDPVLQDEINGLLTQLEAKHRADAHFKHEMTRDIWGLSNAIWEEYIRPHMAHPGTG